MELVTGDMRAQIARVFDNLGPWLRPAASLADVVKLNVYLTDLAHFPGQRGDGAVFPRTFSGARPPSASPPRPRRGSRNGRHPDSRSGAPGQEDRKTRKNKA